VEQLVGYSVMTGVAGLSFTGKHSSDKRTHKSGAHKCPRACWFLFGCVFCKLHVILTYGQFVLCFLNTFGVFSLVCFEFTCQYRCN